jgi:hypothetical protein
LRTFAVLLVHGIVDECLIQSAGATQDLLLCSGSAHEASTGLNTVGEIQSKRPESVLNEASRRSQRCFIRDLNPCFQEGAALNTRQRSVRGDAPLGATSGLHSITPNDFLTVPGDIETVVAGFYRGPTECCRDVSGDVQFLTSRGGHLLGIEASEHMESAHVVAAGGLEIAGYFTRPL